MNKNIFISLSISLILLTTTTLAQERKKNLSHLHELLNTQITSVSRKPEDPFRAPAAIYVITKHDIERSGATTIAEALRLAPGMQVAQSGANWWAISARGFNDNIANKLLVQIDGRSVYTPLFGGVYWDTQDVLLEDIKQIEIIRGPGASLWGANAVNGIVNIITEEAIHTLDKLVTFTAGSEENIAAARIGGAIGDHLHYRIYSKYTDRDDSKQLGSNQSAQDSWDMKRVGFRADWDQSTKTTFTLQGDIYKGNLDRVATLFDVDPLGFEEVNDPGELQGGNLLGRFEHFFDSGAHAALHIYYDHIERNFSVSRDERSTIDIDFQHGLAPYKWHEITWGMGYRLNQSTQESDIINQGNIDDVSFFNYNPRKRTDNLFSLFIQDKITLLPETLYLTLGSKFEENNYTGFEAQPSARIAWHVNTHHTLWGAVSRAISTPSRVHDDIEQKIGVVPGAPAGFISWIGDRDYESEELIAYELGYRTRPKRNMFFDLTAFFFEYDNLRTTELQTAFSVPQIALPLTFDNQGYGESYGLELSATWDISDHWQLTGAYSFLKNTNHLDEASNDVILNLLEQHEGTSPQNQFNLRSRLLLPHNVELNNMLYYVDSLPAFNIDSYMRFDSRIAWRPKKRMEFSIVGKNLLDNYHQEFRAIPVLPNAEISRSVFAKLSLTF